MYKKFFGIMILAVCAPLVFTSCVLLTEGAGRVLDGSAFAEKKTAALPLSSNPETRVVSVINRKREEALLITNKRFPNLKLYGSKPGADGRFSITRMYLMSVSYGGWNEVYYDVYGTALLTPASDAASNAAAGAGAFALTFETPIEAVTITKGAVLRGGSRLEGARALEELRRREERIDALVTWMKKSGNEFAPREPAEKDGAYLKKENFSAYWKPVLLPEILSGEFRTDKYKKLAREEKGNIKYEWGEDVLWNTNYTKILFPEFMRRFRDSGALYRDWDEAFDWIYIKYIWQEIPQYLSNS